MGGLVTSLGFGGGGDTGAAGVHYVASGTNIQSPISVQDAQAAQAASINDIQQQQNFVNALAAQNGIANQSNVYNQLGNIAAGQGPNPAMAALNQATANNTANQAALMAGQRGSSANTGLIARQAAQQGAANQQNAIGQGATLQAQQSLNALNMQGGIAGQQIQNQAAGLGNLNQQQQNLLGQQLGSIQGVNTANVQMQGNMNQANAGIANTVAQGQQALAGGVMQGIGSMLQAPSLAKGGMVKKMADGGNVDDMPSASSLQMPEFGSSLSASPTISSVAPASQGPASSVGKFVNSSSDNSAQAPAGNAMMNSSNPGAAAISNGMASIGKGLSPGAQATNQAQGITGGGGGGGGGLMGLLALLNKGGKVPVLLSPGEKALSPEQAKAVAQGKASPMEGKTVPGKSKYAGDDERNDTFRTALEPGGVVIPRSKVKDEKKAADFVAAVMSKGGRMPKKA